MRKACLLCVQEVATPKYANNKRVLSSGAQYTIRSVATQEVSRRSTGPIEGEQRGVPRDG